MKKLMIAAGAVALLAGRVAAWEVKDNPDRYISVGLYTGMTTAGGSHSNTLDPATVNEVVQMEGVSNAAQLAGFDVRLPLFRQCTFTASYDQFAYDQSGVRTGNTFQTHDHLHGQTVKFGFRLYLTK